MTIPGRRQFRGRSTEFTPEVTRIKRPSCGLEATMPQMADEKPRRIGSLVLVIGLPAMIVLAALWRFLPGDRTAAMVTKPADRHLFRGHNTQLVRYHVPEIADATEWERATRIPAVASMC